MGEAFIVRKGGGGVGERTTTPSINFVSKTDSEIVVTFTNNDAAEAEVFFGITSTLTDTVTLAAAATSSNITFSGLDDDTAFTVSAFALVTDPTSKKIKSEIVTTVITTDAIIFTAATGGTTLEYNSGGKRFRSHTFTSNGNFVVSTVGDNVDDRNKVDYLIIAGGGGGNFNGGNRGSGGGGAGGYRTTFGTQGGNGTLDTKVTVTSTSFSVNIGAGASNLDANGVNSSVEFADTITSTGGGRSGGNFTLNTVGGSGGGAGNNTVGGVGGSGSAGTTNQGSRGGNQSTGGAQSGAGGGGAGGAASNGQAGGSAGGVGLSSIIRTGSAEFRAGGGGGNATSSDGGGNSSNKNGTANTGGGAGGSGVTASNGGNGGSGIVIIRYEIAPSV